MTEKDDITPIIQYHQGIGGFNYDLAVDWAISLIEKGDETDNVFMLASFQKPVYYHEIRPYLSYVLEDLGLEEEINERTLNGYTHYYVKKILRGENIRDNLKFLKELYIDEEFHPIDKIYLDNGLFVFYNLYWAWVDVENGYYPHDYEEATKDNIEDLVHKESVNWVNEYIHGIKDDGEVEKPMNIPIIKEKRKSSFSIKLKKWFAR